MSKILETIFINGEILNPVSVKKEYPLFITSVQN